MKCGHDLEVTHGLATTDSMPDTAKTGTYKINVKKAVMIKEINKSFSKWLRLMFVFSNTIERNSQITTVPKG